MSVTVREYCHTDAGAARRIWNEVVNAGNAFPQIEPLGENEADEFFSAQTYTGVAVDEETGEVVGLYILHPNNVGRCAHIANASYAVRSDMRGRHIGEMLVTDSLRQSAAHGFRIVQFNAVVSSNIHAIHLYERLGFVRLGTVPDGYLLPDGTYQDIVLFYHIIES